MAARWGRERDEPNARLPDSDAASAQRALIGVGALWLARSCASICSGIGNRNRLCVLGDWIDDLGLARYWLALLPMAEETEQPSEHLVEPSRIEPATEENRPTLGAKMFVIFFLLIVPPLGIVLLVAVCWSLWKLVMSNA